MPSIAELAYQEALQRNLDLSVQQADIDPDVFSFKCLEPKDSIVQAILEANHRGLPWPPDMPLPVVTYSRRDRDFRIMDGMLRICSAKRAGLTSIPALVASGETYEALAHILDEGYYGEDFVEMLAMSNPLIRRNLDNRDRNLLAGR